MAKGSKIIGVDIGSYSTKIVYFNKNVIKNKIEIKTPHGIIRDGDIIDEGKVVEVIKSAMKSKKIKAKEIAFSMNSTDSIVRNFEIQDQDTPEQFKSALELQIAEVLNNILDTHSMAFKISKKEGGMVHGMYTLAPYDVVSKYRSVAEKLKLKIKYVDIQPNCGCKYYANMNKGEKDSKCVVLVNIGHSSVHVSLSIDGKLAYNRALQGGVSVIDSMLERELGLSPEEAKDCRLGNYDKYNISEEEIDRYIRISSISIDDYIRQAFDFASYSKTEAIIQKIILCGSGAKISKIDEHIGESYSVPIEVLDEDRVFINAIGVIYRDKELGGE